MHHLMRYFHLLVFQAYLDDTNPDEEESYSFESFVKHRPVFKTLEKELLQGGLDSLTPLDRADPATGMAVSLELSENSHNSLRMKSPTWWPAVRERSSRRRL